MGRFREEETEAWRRYREELATYKNCATSRKGTREIETDEQHP
jgi:hypothetical protein